MADGDSSPEEIRARLRADFHAQTARISYAELQRYFAGGHLVLVSPSMDLVDVAVALATDNKARFEDWIASGEVAGVTDEQARSWLAENADLWAVVANPWVLVQDLPTG